MIWTDHGLGGWGWFTVSLSVVIFWAAITGLGVLLFGAIFRALGRAPEPPPDRRAPPPCGAPCSP
ncbi:hypothetical protein ACWC9T_18590 [Kitasatospora sp. NPDC001159]